MEFTYAITEFIAKGMMPLSAMTMPGVMALINTRDKRYSMPSCTYFSQVAIMELHKKMQTESQQS